MPDDGPADAPPDTLAASQGETIPKVIS